MKLVESWISDTYRSSLGALKCGEKGGCAGAVRYSPIAFDIVWVKAR